MTPSRRTATLRAALTASLATTLGLGLVSAPAGSTAARATGAVTADETDPGLLPDRIVLNPTAEPDVAQFVTWRTSKQVADGFAEVRQGDGPIRRVAAGAPTDPVWTGPGAVHHTARLGGLKPGTTYRYRVGTPGAWSSWASFHTATSTQTANAWDFLYFGDAQTGLNTVWGSVVRQAKQRVPGARLTLHAGDLVNEASDIEQWRDWFNSTAPFRRSTNMLTAPGNHELVVDLPLEQYKAHFGLPTNGPSGQRETAWYADYQGVRFVSLNGNDPFPGLRQKQWLDQVLSANQQRFTVVTFHKPIFSGRDGRDNRAIRNAWLPVLEKHNVDLVLQGHDHVYARGHLKDRQEGPGVSSGPEYVVSSAGAKYYKLDTEGGNNWTDNGAVRTVAHAQTSTYQRITVAGNKLIYRSFIGAKGAESTAPGAVGTQLDAFTVVHRADGSKRVFNGVR